MTTIGYISDVHLRSTRPVCRLDEKFYEMQLAKFREALDIMQGASDVRFQGGDLMHLHTPALSLLNDVIEVLGVGPLLEVNPGNHDFFGANAATTLRRSGLGILKAAGALEILTDGEVGYPARKVIVRSASYRIDYGENFYWFDEKRPEYTYVVIAHDMLTTRPVPFPHKEISKLKTNADVVLCSHWHSQFMEKHGNTLFVNTGPLDIQTVTERHTKPAVAIINIKGPGDIGARFEYLTTTGYEEIEVRDEDIRDAGLADDFIKEVQRGSLADGADIEQAILFVAKESGYDPVVAQQTLNRVKQAQACVEA